MTAKLIALGALLSASSAMAQTITVATVTGVQRGNTATVPVTYTSGASAAGYQVTISYAALAAQLSGPPTVQAAPVPPATCTVDPMAQTVTVFRFTFPAAVIADETACTLLFPTSASATAGTYALVTSGASASTTGGMAIPATGVDGSVQITLGPQPRYTSVPAAGNPGAAVLITDPLGGGASTATLAVTNSGPTGAGNLTLSAISGLSGVLGITPAAPINIAQGTTSNLTISCTATSVGDTVQTLTITHNGEAAGTGAASPVTHQVTCRGVNVDTPPTVSLGAAVQPPAGPINVTAAGSVPLNVDSAGAPTANVSVNCTFPTPGPANFQVTAGATRTIAAPATTGPNAPAIAVQCTRQAAAQVAALSCARTTVPASNPALTPLTVDFTCPAGTTAPNPAVNPASGSTIPFSGPPGSAVSGAVTFTNTGGTQTYDITGCTLGGVSPANFAITGPTFPATVGLNGSQAVGLRCNTPASPGAPVTATLTCTTNTQLNPTFTLSCQSLVLAVPTMGWGGKALMILLVLGFGLVGFQLYRRTA
jgi:hypothetical protein